jgi:thiamine-monophosphate kinase
MTGEVTAMIDLSDGLSRDLIQICQQSGVGAAIEGDRVPIHPDAVAASRDGRTPLDHALNDGEDHELLVTGTLDDFGPPLVRIGRTTSAHEILLSGEKGIAPLTPRGWEHSI